MSFPNSLSSVIDDCPRMTGTAFGLLGLIILLILSVCCIFSSSYFMRTRLCNYFSPCTTTTVEAYKNIDKRYIHH